MSKKNKKGAKYHTNQKCIERDYSHFPITQNMIIVAHILRICFIVLIGKEHIYQCYKIVK